MTQVFGNLFIGQGIDLRGGVSGAEAIINVHDGDAAAATVQHAQQGGESAKAGAVTHTRGHGNDGLRHESGHDTGQRAFHSGNHDNDIRAANRFNAIQQPVHAGDADIAHALHGVAHDFCGDRGFFGHGQITRAGAGDGDGAWPFRQRFFFNRKATGEFVVNGAFKFFSHGARVLRGNAGGENVLAVIEEFGGDFHDLLRCFAGAENHFGETFAQGAMSIHLGKADIRNGGGLKGLQDLFPAHTAGAEFFQELSRFGDRHVPTMPQKLAMVTRENGMGETVGWVSFKRIVTIGPCRVPLGDTAECHSALLRFARRS